MHSVCGPWPLLLTYFALFCCIVFLAFIVNFIFFHSFTTLHPKSSMSRWILFSMNKSLISSLLIFKGSTQQRKIRMWGISCLIGHHYPSLNQFHHHIPSCRILSLYPSSCQLLCLNPCSKIERKNRLCLLLRMWNLARCFWRRQLSLIPRL